jgi:3-oxoacyl-[acyl-carrier protein] reductase
MLAQEGEMETTGKGLLEGRVAWVTGGSRGIGKAIALELAREGANVAVNSNRSAADAEVVAQEIQAMGRRSMAVIGDVADRDTVGKMAASIAEELGTIDILVNNAGYGGPTSWETLSVEEWDRSIGVNLTGVFNCVQAVVGGMKAQRYGKIVSTSSMTGVRGALNDNAQYAAAKAGIHGFSWTLARRLAPYRINVNVVAPGPIGTETYLQGIDPDDQARRLAGIPWGEVGRPEDIAHAVVFLASDWARYITGVVLPICGGFHMG